MKYLRWAFNIAEGDEKIPHFFDRVSDNLSKSFRLGGENNPRHIFILFGTISYLIEIAPTLIRELILSANISLDESRDTLMDALPTEEHPILTAFPAFIIYLVWIGIKIPLIAAQIATGVSITLVHSITRCKENFKQLRTLLFGKNDGKNKKTAAVSFILNLIVGVGIYFNQSSVITSVLTSLGIGTTAIFSLKIIVAAILTTFAFSFVGQLIKDAYEIKESLSIFPKALSRWFDRIKTRFYPDIEITEDIKEVLASSTFSNDAAEIAINLHKYDFNTAYQKLISIFPMNIEIVRKKKPYLLLLIANEILLKIKPFKNQHQHLLPQELYAAFILILMRNINKYQRNLTPKQKEFLGNLYLCWPNIPIDTNFNIDNLANKFIKDLSQYWNKKVALGSGSYGIVVRGKILEKTLAIKLQKPYDNEKSACEDLFLNEIFIEHYLNQSPNDHIPQIYHFSLYGTPGFAMECGESSLRALASQENRLPRKDALNYFKQLLQGLQFLHSKGLLHRDLSANNVLLFAGGIVKIIDFGTACLIKQNGEERSFFESQCVTTISYRAPEAPNECSDEPGQYSTASDVFAAVLVFLEMLKGEIPYRFLMVNSIWMTASLEKEVHNYKVGYRDPFQNRSLGDESNRVSYVTNCITPDFSNIILRGLDPTTANRPEITALITAIDEENQRLPCST